MSVLLVGPQSCLSHAGKWSLSVPCLSILWRPPTSAHGRCTPWLIKKLSPLLPSKGVCQARRNWTRLLQPLCLLAMLIPKTWSQQARIYVCLSVRDTNYFMLQGRKGWDMQELTGLDHWINEGTNRRPEFEEPANDTGYSCPDRKKPTEPTGPREGCGLVKKQHGITEPQFSRFNCVKAASRGHTSRLVLLLFDNFFQVAGREVPEFSIPEKMVAEYFVFSPELSLQNGWDMPETLKLSIGNLDWGFLCGKYQPFKAIAEWFWFCLHCF